ncbi:MAG: Fe-S cluster assembly protein SufD [Armatimonadota bacterium]|nr:Fe-S cluster assembly protein SufD [Armatimonadota bacterium]
MIGLDLQQEESNSMEQFVPAAVREEAGAIFDRGGFPSTKDEEWRFTSLREIAETDFIVNPDPNTVLESDIDPVALPSGASRLVFVDGRFDPDLSHTADLPDGVVVSSLKYAITEHRDIVEKYFSKLISLDETAFVALNTRLVIDGAFICVPKDVVIDKPIYVTHVAAGHEAPALTNPRSLFIFGRNSQAKIVESFVSIDGPTWQNAVLEASVGEGAVVEHVRLQLGSEEAYHITNTQIDQGRNSNFKTTVVTLGGKIVRNDINGVLNGEGAECTMNGLYVGRADQHVDNHTRLDHAQPNCPSHELFKGVLADKSSAVFNGKIIVRQIAQKTDSKQSNMTILLSDDAMINTKPQLEIFADDVRCTHGATIGRLDEEAMFYLRSRGIPEREARGLLIYAFASDVLDRVGVPEIKETLEARLFERFYDAP